MFRIKYIFGCVCVCVLYLNQTTFRLTKPTEFAPSVLAVRCIFVCYLSCTTTNPLSCVFHLSQSTCAVRCIHICICMFIYTVVMCSPRTYIYCFYQTWSLTCELAPHKRHRKLIHISPHRVACLYMCLSAY